MNLKPLIAALLFESNRICSHPLVDKYSIERFELACAKVLSYTPCPSFKSVQAILKSGQDKLTKNESKSETKTSNPSDTATYGFTGGADYYKRGTDKC